MKLILSCEHAGNGIPETYASYFSNKDLLKTHRGYDLGALDLFHALKPLAQASFYSSISRLFIELNRSVHHRQLFSDIMKDVSTSEKKDIIKTYYSPYRTAVETEIRNFITKGHTVIHLSIHSFTPELKGKTRNADIGLLYDSRNKIEQKFCKDLKTALLEQNPDLNVRFNYPYLGKADGFTTYLRNQFPIDYLGIEIEVNQKFSVATIMDSKLKASLYNAINNTISTY